MPTHSSRSASPAVLSALVLSALALSGCGLAEDIADSLDGTNSKEHQVDTGAEGKESGLLAGWVPDDAQDVRVMQRTTGSERLLTFEYAGELPDECLQIEAVGSPSAQELDEAYATDPRTQDWEVEEWSTSPTLEADWWQDGQEELTTHLCGRWWVSEADGTIYGFGAELHG